MSYLHSDFAPSIYAGVQSMLLSKFGMDVGIHSSAINSHVADALAYYACDKYISHYIPILMPDSPQVQYAINQYLTAVLFNYALSRQINAKAGINNALAVFAEPQIVGFLSPAGDL